MLASRIPAPRESHRLAPSAEDGLRPHPGIRPHLFADPAAVKVRSALHLDGPMLCPPSPTGGHRDAGRTREEVLFFPWGEAARRGLHQLRPSEKTCAGGTWTTTHAEQMRGGFKERRWTP